MHPCAECGFDPETHGAGDLPGEIRAVGRRFRPPLTRLLRGEDESILRIRPREGVWSALEYAAHVENVLGFYRRRIDAVISEDRPRLVTRDPDELDDAEVEPTLTAIAELADGIATTLESLDDEGWARVGIGTEGDERSVLVLARRALHDAHHHLLDIGRGLRRVRQAGED